jgi:hypothetical protein
MWIQTSKSDPVLIEVDTNGDGDVVKSGPNADMTNGQLAQMGVNVGFVAMKHNLKEKSPWDGNMDLWYSVDPNVAHTFGYILVSSVGSGVFIQAFEKNNPSAIMDKFIVSE